jgi:hypothetical protein
MSAASLPTVHKRLGAGTGQCKSFINFPRVAGITGALVAKVYDIETVKDTGSDAESESESEPVARWSPAEDELAYRPEHGYGQRPYAITKRTRIQKPMRNVTTAFARDIQEHGDIAALPSTPRGILQELLEMDQKLKEATSHGDSRLDAPKVRRPAEEVFPGKIPLKKEVPHFGSNKNATSANNAFSKLQLQRALYEDGNDDIDGLQAMGKLALLSMWMQRRDEVRSAQGAGQRAYKEAHDGAMVLVEGTEDAAAVSGTVHAGVPAAQEYDDGPTSLAATYLPQEPQAWDGSINAETPAGALAPESANTIRHEAAVPTADDVAPAHAAPTKTGRGCKKNGENDPEVARRIALAARVDRYPLSLPGHNENKPLSMHLNLSASTIGQKFNMKMTTQLLKDYGLLPTDPKVLKSRLDLANHLFKEREKLIKDGVKLQEPWSTARLEAYVAAQEAAGAIPPAGAVPGASRGNAQGAQMPSFTQASAGSTPAAGPSNAPKKRGRVEEDLLQDEAPFQLQPRKMAKTKATKTENAATSLTAISCKNTTTKKRSLKGKDPKNGKVDTASKSRPRKAEQNNHSAQATSSGPMMPSAYTTTDYGPPFQSLPVANQTQYGGRPTSNAFHHAQEQHLSQNEIDQTSWDRRLHELQFGTVGQSAYQQQPTYQSYSTFDYSNAYQQGYWQSSQVPTSAYTMTPAASLTNDTTQSSVPDILIDPALLNLQ